MGLGLSFEGFLITKYMENVGDFYLILIIIVINYSIIGEIIVGS